MCDPSRLWRACVLLMCVSGPPLPAAEQGADSGAKPTAGKPQEAPAASGLVRLAKDYDLWIDPQRKLVIVDGYVCLREGQLEMFACPRQTKEHESIVAVNCKAQFIHAALLAVGAKPGAPMQWSPDYKPATGPIVDVMVLWQDPDGTKRKARAQEWIKDVKADKEMSYPWVFAGSSVWKDEQTGQTYYQADGGDLICVSNFPSAMLDVPVQSSQVNVELMFVAFTERIPPLKTKVRLVLVPRLEKEAKAAATGKAGQEPAKTKDTNKPAPK